jgi:uncharacterized membrane protein
MQVLRVLRHLILPDWWVGRVFPPAALQAIEQAVAASEATHRGELRVVVETNLPLPALLGDQSPRARAVELFAQLRVWDTEENSGVLIYLQLLDRRVEILADRGIDAKLGQAFWDAICRQMEVAFRAGDFSGGLQRALATVTAALHEHFPATTDNPDELPNAPLLI